MRRVPPLCHRHMGAGVTSLAGEPDVQGNGGRDHDPLEMVADSYLNRQLYQDTMGSSSYLWTMTMGAPHGGGSTASGISLRMGMG